MARARASDTGTDGNGRGAVKVGGKLDNVAIELLQPDAWNPRLLPDVQEKRLAPDDLFEHLDRVYDVVSIARSIVRHGYFGSEPLIAVPADGAYDDESRAPDAPQPVDATKPLVVVEGNRRLTALRGLGDQEIRAALADPGWGEMPPPEDVELPHEIPVLLVDHRDRVAPILGYRHITGIAQWEPLPQAKFISDFVDRKDFTFAAVASLIDRPETEVRSYYRNYWIHKRLSRKSGRVGPSSRGRGVVCSRC